MKLVLIVLKCFLVSGFQNITFSQCLRNIAFNSQSQINNFPIQYPNCTAFIGQVFEIDSIDTQNTLAVSNRRKWPEFKIVLKKTKDKGNWLLDSCGIVNIPNHLKAKR